MEPKHKFIGISLALGDIYDDDGTGKLIRPVDGAIARYELVRDYVEEFSDNRHSVIICTAGYSKGYPRCIEFLKNGNLGRMASLSEQLFRYCSENGTRLPLAYSLCWSTRNEVRIGIKTALRCFASREELVTVVIASNLTHLIRIWLYAKMYTPKGWNFKLIRVKHQFTLMSHLMEVPKFIRDFDYTLRVHSRLNRLRRYRSV